MSLDRGGDNIDHAKAMLKKIHLKLCWACVNIFLKYELLIF